MRLDAITVALRTRTPWEATDLGVALVRAHARRIWAAWILITLPVFALFNALGYACDAIPLASAAFWWCKPVFDRVPLYIISRAVFGAAPSVRETLAAQRNWGWRALLAWLTWRRLHPGRAMLLPVDLLEGVRGAQRKQRVYVLSRAHASPNMMLTVLGANLELVFMGGVLLLVLMFVPLEFLEPSARAMWHTLFESPPPWAEVVGNALYWLAMSVVEPFYIGAGFGLYLNRRMQLEAWDVELAFRRLAARLTPSPFAAAAALLLACAIAGAALPLDAAAAARPAPGKTQTQRAPAAQEAPDIGKDEDADTDEDDGADAAAEPAPDAKEGAAQDRAADGAADSHDAKAAKPEPKVSDDGLVCKLNGNQKRAAKPLADLFARNYRDDGAAFEAAVKQAYADGELNPKIKEFVWKLRHQDQPDTRSSGDTSWMRAIGAVFGFIAEYGLWIAIAILLAIVLLNHRRWLPWITGGAAFAPPPPLPTALGALPLGPEPLPDDLAGAVRALIAQGRMRAALALFYRAAVARLVERLGAPLPPGATESDCLRRARALADGRYATLFARIVRCWQAAAYAQRAPAAPEIDALLEEWTRAETPA